MLHPVAARETIGLMSFIGNLAIAEALAPRAEQAIAVLGDMPGGSWTDIHLCFDCFCDKLGNLPGLVEQANAAPAEEDRDA